jgi:hypothetical protein
VVKSRDEGGELSGKRGGVVCAGSLKRCDLRGNTGEELVHAGRVKRCDLRGNDTNEDLRGKEERKWRRREVRILNEWLEEMPTLDVVIVDIMI